MVIVIYTSMFLKLYIDNLLFYVYKIYVVGMYFLYKNFNSSLYLLNICSVWNRFEYMQLASDISMLDTLFLMRSRLIS